jgi:transcriptional regulator with XRE-family HTH domain
LIEHNHVDMAAMASRPDDDMPLNLAIDDDPDLRLRMGRYLGGIRQLQKISQQQAAKDLKMSRPHLSNIERGRARTGWKGLRKMAQHYGYGVQQLIDEVERDTPRGSVTQIPRLLPKPDKTPADPPADPPAAPLAAPADAAPFERNMSQVLLNDVRFVTDMFLALDAEARSKFVDHLKGLVLQRFDKMGDE